MSGTQAHVAASNVVVPQQPSDVMLEAGCAAMGPGHGNVVTVREIWRAMLAAAEAE